MKNSTSLVALTLIAAWSFNLARADTLGDAPSEIVRFSDLNIDNWSGAESLYRRLSTAAINVCRPLEPGRSLALIAQHRACVHAALSKALADVGNPTVLAYAASHRTASADVTLRMAQSK